MTETMGMAGPLPSEAFESLFRREYRGVVAAARRIVGEAVAEDIAQDAFAALYGRGPSDPAHAKNWLYRTALHRAISTLRSTRRRTTRETGSGALPPIEPEDPQTTLERRELRDEVQHVLRKLHRRYAVVLALRHSGMSYKEIAAVMNVNINQVGTLLVRAEAAFKKELDRVSSR